MKVTTIGSAVIDIFLNSDNFTIEKRESSSFLCQVYGRKVDLINHDITTGGAASNCAVAFARRGHDVSIIAELGQDDFANIIKNTLISEKVNTQYLIQERSEKTGCSIILRGSDGGRTIMVSRSASAMLDDYDIPLDYLATRDWIHLSSIGGNLNALSEIWQVFDRAPAIGFSWNPGSKELKHLAEGALTLPPVNQGAFFVNQEEWAIVARLHKQILQTFPYVVVTAGGKGGTLYVDGQLARDFEPKNPGGPREETGAGDAFASAFASTLLYGRPVEEALTAALNNADSVIQFLGAKQGLLAF